MLDIVRIEEGFDLGFQNTVVTKAGNVLAVQQTSLEYAPNFGVDLKFFLGPDFQFQNESFKGYLVERLTQHQINVATVFELVESLYTKFTFDVGDANAGAEGLL